MAKSKHARKKTKRVRHWAIWLEDHNKYYSASDGTMVLYGTHDIADAMARRLWYRDNEPCRVDRVEVREI